MTTAESMDTVLVKARLDGEAPPDHVQRVGGAHGDDAGARARREPERRRHAPVAALIQRRVRDVPVRTYSGSGQVISG